MNNRALVFTLILVSVLAVVSSTSIILNYRAQAVTPATTSTITMGGTNTDAKVQVGGGNNTYPLMGYKPQMVEIKVGDSVVWNAPSNAPQEPHTVTFVLDNKTMTTSDTPFAISTSTNFMSLPPGANSQPTTIPGKNGMNTIVASNARVYSPTIIDSTGKVRMAPPNAIFTLMGDEKYVNSGWLAPKGSPFPGSSDTFSLTFQKAGTYTYLCILHPWMAGQVVVK
jgi:plastocyanin